MKIANALKGGYLVVLLTVAALKNEAVENDEYGGLSLTPNGWSYQHAAMNAKDLRELLAPQQSVHKEMEAEIIRCRTGGGRYLQSSRSKQLDNDYEAKRRLDKFGHAYHVARNHFAHGYGGQLDPWEIYVESLKR